MRASGSRRSGRGAQALAVALVLLAADAVAQQAPARPGAQQAQAPAQKGKDPQAPAQATPRRPLAESLTGMAQAEHGAAMVLLQQGDCPGAIEKLERAYELSRDHRLLWYVASCQKDLKRYARLLTTLRRMKEDAGEKLAAEELRDLADLTRIAEALVTRLEITASEPGAAVLVDDEAVGTAPLAGPVTVDMGDRRVRITKQGFKDFVHVAKGTGGGQIAIAATLEKVVHRGRIMVTAGSDDLIALDGRVVGRGRWEGSVPSGTHALRVTAPGKQTYASEVLVRDHEARRVDVELPVIEKSRTATWLWIGGGVALLAGAAVAGAVLFEPGRPAQQGTLGSFPLSFGGRR